MAQLSVYLLGPYHVTNGKPAPTRFEYDKVRALLAYLAVENDRPQRREFLAGLLWPEQPERAALSSLRQAILKLRQAIGDTSGGDSPGGNAASDPHFLIVRRDSIQLNPLSAYSLDVLEFATLIEATRLHQHRNPNTCPPCAENRTRAVQLYRGDFLGQLSLGDCPAFESWTVIKREQCRSLVLRALLSLTSFHLHRGELELAQQYASRQIEIDPLREQAYRQRMAALALDGQRTAALRSYETCRRLLEEELDIEPEEATQELYHLIKAGFYFRSRDESLDALTDYR